MKYYGHVPYKGLVEVSEQPIYVPEDKEEVRHGTDNDWSSSISADKLAKMRPLPKVFDADGVEIKVGDTVWVKGDVNKGKVEEVHKDRVWVKWNDGWLDDVHVSHITHREPDSLEKLLVELRGVNFIPSKDYLNHLADRLAAIMERDA